MKNTVLEVNKKKFLENVEKIKKYVGEKEIMPVIKANAYGTYLNKELDILNRFQVVAVAQVQEGIELRKVGYEKEIFILNQPGIEELEEIESYNLTIGLSEIEFLKQVNRPIKVHLEIETGMNRTGIKLENLEDFCKIIQENKNITVEGAYTHFSSADNDFEYTKMQLEKFRQAITYLKKLFVLKYIHCSASNGILNQKEEISNTVRPGIILYGYEPFKGAKEIIPIEPITKLKSKITYLKEVEEGESISYNQTYKTTSPRKIATIPIGYADGLRRILSNKGEVVVKGQRCKIVGNICMDSCMIDVTGLDVKVGDTVYLWDNEQVTLDEVSSLCNTIHYEILSTISDRVERKIEKE